MQDKKIRMTRQRRAILEELKKVNSHPTADEIYGMVRQRLPRISLGTVYRNLEFLAEGPLIQKLDLPGTQMRFDGKAENHYHVRCHRCNRVDDLPIEPLTSIADELGKAVNGYEIFGHRFELIGLCPECRADKESSHRGTRNEARKEA